MVENAATAIDPRGRTGSGLSVGAEALVSMVVIAAPLAVAAILTKGRITGSAGSALERPDPGVPRPLVLGALPRLFRARLRLGGGFVGLEQLDLLNRAGALVPIETVPGATFVTVEFGRRREVRHPFA